MKPGPPPNIETERLILREFLEKDLERMFIMRSNKRVMDMIDQPPHDLEKVKELLKSNQEGNKSGEMLTWIMADKSTDDMIGFMGFWRINWDHYRAEIGYAILEDYFGQGYTSEAMPAVLDYVFNNTEIHSINADINPKNGASRRVLQKNGFVKEGLFRESYYRADTNTFEDSEMYGLLKSEWDK